jgi:hypothetical protein
MTWVSLVVNWRTLGSQPRGKDGIGSRLLTGCDPHQAFKDGVGTEAVVMRAFAGQADKTELSR